MSPKEVLDFAKENGARQLDLRFTDLPGLSHHVSYPISILSDSSFEEGFGFDGSSIRGWAVIHESDMLLLPDPSTAFMDPFTDVATLNILCDIEDPITRERYSRDPRNVAKKAEAYLRASGIADTAYRPNTLVDWVMWKYPLAKLLVSSPAMQTLRYVQGQFPTLYPGGAVDSFPLMAPGQPPVTLPEHADLTPAPRDPAQMDSQTRPTM